jgi:hypothetical protein
MQKVDRNTLMVINHTSKVLFQYMIHLFSLSIYLRMISWKKLDIKGY